MTIEINRPEIEALIQQRLHSGAFESVEDVLFDALKIQSDREAWLQEDKEAINAKIERGLAQLDRGEGTPGNQLRERLDGEAAAQRSISSTLGPLITLIEQTISLYERAAHAIADHSRPGAAAKVGLVLIARLANDLRVCALSAQLGYGIQALGLGATVVELVGALSYVGGDDERAEKWARHTDQKNTYPRRVSDGIDAAVASLGMSSQDAQYTKENWQQAYTFMCTAKHANPRISIINGLRIDPDDLCYEYGYGPDASAFGTRISAEAMYYAIGFGMSGILVALVHCSDELLQTQLRAEALNVLQARHGLEAWLHRMAQSRRT